MRTSLQHSRESVAELFSSVLGEDGRCILNFSPIFFSKRKCTQSPLEGTSSGMCSSCCVRTGCSGLSRWMPLEPQLQLRNHLQQVERKRLVGKFILMRNQSLPIGLWFIWVRYSCKKGACGKYIICSLWLCSFLFPAHSPG